MVHPNLMDALLFFLGTLIMVAAATWCVTYGLWMHHKREMYRHRIREEEIREMFLLSDKALEHGMLPPVLRNDPRYSGERER